MDELKHWGVVDKSKWGDGKWMSEPDKVQWTYKGYPCAIVRGPSGSWCGYVGVGITSPAFGKAWDELEVSVHGGVTYARLAEWDAEPEGISFVPPTKGQGQVWAIGFDCAHYGDYSPKYESKLRGLMREEGSYVYKDVEYVRREVELMVCQLITQELEGARKAWKTFRNYLAWPLTWLKCRYFVRKIRFQFIFWRMRRVLEKSKGAIEAYQLERASGESGKGGGDGQGRA